MARLTIPDEATSADFTVTTEQSVFPFSFAIFEKADLRVTANGLNVDQSAFTFAGTRLEGGGYQGGAITLNTPVTSGAVRVWRRIKPVRPSNFASQASVPVRSVDMEFNKVVAQQQDVMLALEDVEAGVVDPDVLAQVVDEAIGQAGIEVTPEAYRGIGLNDSQAIQAAIDAVTAIPGGGSVRLDGRYTCTAPVMLKSNVKLHGGTLKADPSLVEGYLIGLTANAKNPMVVGVNIDCTEMVPEPLVYGATAIMDFGGCRGVLIADNTFELADTDETSPFVPWHACFMQNSQGVVSGNYCGVCGGDTYNFNGGRWVITGNYAQDSADGGIALNNGINAIVTGNYLYKCNLGIGAGPHGTTASPFRSLHVSGNVVESCAVGINVGWYGYAGRVPAQYMTVSDNTILRCRDMGIAYISANGADELAPRIHNNTVAECGSTSYTGVAGTGTGIAVVGCTYPSVQGNHVVKSQGTEGVAYVLSGVYKAVFANNSSFENTVDIKYEECSLYLGPLWTDRAEELSIQVGTIVRLTDYREFKNAKIAELQLGSAGLMYYTEAGNYPRLIWDGSDGAQQAYNRTTNQFEFDLEGVSPLRLGTGGISVLGSPMSFEKDYVGTTNGSGAFNVAHGIPSATQRFRGAKAMVQEGGGNWVTIPSVGVDGSTIGFSGAAASRPCRVIATWSAALL